MKTTTKQLVLTAFMTGVLCLVAPFTIPLPFSPVPITLATLVLYLNVYILDWKQCMMCCTLYLLLGAVGLPVFSGFNGGLSRLAGPTGGYLIGYLFLALISSWIFRYSQRKWVILCGFLIGTAVTYLFGTLWLIRQLHLTFVEGIFMGMVPYLPGDFFKMFFALWVGPILQNRIKHI